MNTTPSIRRAALGFALLAGMASSRPAQAQSPPTETPTKTPTDTPAEDPVETPTQTPADEPATTCRTSPECADHGRCTSRDGRCVARDRKDCRASSDCRTKGLCSRDGDVCVARSVRRCEASQLCREAGRCYPMGDACVAARDSDCRASTLCTERDLCYAVDGRCQAEVPPPPPPPDDLASWSESQEFQEHSIAPTKERESFDLWAAPGVSILTGEGSNFFDPSFNLDLVGGFRWGYAMMGARLRFNPLNPNIGSGSAFHFGASLMPAFRPFQDGWFDIAIGANLGYFMISADGPGGSATVHGLQAGPWGALLFTPELDENSRLITGVTFEWSALIGATACLNGTCSSVDYAGEGAASVGLILGASFDL